MGFDVDLIIAQSALDRGDGVSALGMGWQVRPPEPVPWALVAVLKATRDTLGENHSVSIRLETEDGSPLDPDLADLLRVDFQFEPEGLEDAGLVSPVVRSYGFNLLPIPLEPGVEYRFRLWIDRETKDHWTASFRTTPP